MNPTKEVTQESDVDVVLAFESFDAMDEFEYDGRSPETIVVGGITRELDLIIGGPESDYPYHRMTTILTTVDRTSPHFYIIMRYTCYMVQIDEQEFEKIFEFHKKNYYPDAKQGTVLNYIEEGYPILKQTAANRDVISYSEFMSKLGTNRRYLSTILGTLSHLELSKGNPPLSVLVVRKGTNNPGEGFMNLYSELGVQHPYPNLSDKEAVERIRADVYSAHCSK